MYRSCITAVLATTLCIGLPLNAAMPTGTESFICATPALPAPLASAVQERLGHAPTAWPKTDLIIPVAVHLILWGKKGDFSTAVIQTLIDNMNWAYDGTGVQFLLVRIDRSNNKAWYQNCLKNEPKMKKRLAYFPADVLNIYSCFMPGLIPGTTTLGIATQPFGNFPQFRSYPENHYMQGIIMAPNTMPVTTSLPDYSYGLTAAHEAGHWLGLFHPFMPGTIGIPSGCSEPGDYVDDTPIQNLPTGACVQNDTCPQPGRDDFTNFMDYRPDDCADHFTNGQVNRMQGVIINYRPSLFQ